MSEERKTMTTDAERPVGDNQNSLTVGPRGPIVFEDFLLFEKMAHFNRERIRRGGFRSYRFSISIKQIPITEAA